MKKTLIIFLAIAIIIIGILTAISINKKRENNVVAENIIEDNVNDLSYKVTDECTEEWEYIQEQAKLELEANAVEEKISPNASMTLKKYYKQCDHTINEYIDISKELLNKTKEDLEEIYENWKIEQFSSNNIILYKEFDSSCGQHYILRNDNGKITIYLIKNNNEEEVYEKTEISIEYLTESDKAQIENGIRVNGNEQLYQLIEDFE